MLPNSWPLMTSIVISKYLLCVQHKKGTHAGLEQLKGEEMMTEMTLILHHSGLPSLVK